MRLVPSAAAALGASLLAAAPAPAAPAPFQRAVPDGLRPVGFAGDAVVADDVRGLLALRAGRPARRLLLRRDVRRTAVSDARLAVVVGGPRRALPGRRETATGRSSGDPYDPYVAAGGRLGGPRTLRLGARTTLAGPPGGPLVPVAECPPLRAAELTPAVDGDTVAWRGCDPTQIVVDRPGGRATIQTDGSVAAVAVDGTRVAWIAVHGIDRPSTLAVTDLATMTTTPVDRLLPARVGDQASVALRGDRVLAVVPDVDEPNFGSCARSAGVVGTPLTAAGDSCDPAQLLPGAQVDIAGREADPRFALTFTPDGGRARTLLQATGIGSFVASTTRVAVTRMGCRTARLLVLATDRRRPLTLPTCLVRLSGTSRPDARGIVRFRLTCRNGCRIPRNAISLEGGRDTNGAIDARADVDLPPRGTTTVAFRLPPELLGRVRAGRTRSRGWGIYPPSGDFVMGRVRFRP